ncbi:MAG: hypothetical protein LBB30_01745 [Candidatus Methanoplasma sp.]|jgi:hypothetical protein|nr:hypothetical protein [Candidatus Methanoplasma sp.]
MASKKKDTSADSKKGNQPKATARHAKITRTREEEIEAVKKRIDNDKYLAKKYEANRKTEIKALPKGERAAAKAELKDSIEKRKEAERKDREKLRSLVHEEKAEKRNLSSEPFDEETWIEEGRKKGKKKERPEVRQESEEALPEPEEIPDEIETEQIADEGKGN